MSNFEIINILKENREQFNQKRSSNNMVIIGFFAPWCGACQAFKPAWNKTMQHMKKNPPPELEGIIATVHDDVMGGIPYKSPDGFPTVRLYYQGKHVKDYKGPRTFEHLMSFIKSHMKKRKGKTRHHHRHHHKQTGGRKTRRSKRRRKRRRKKTHKKRKRRHHKTCKKHRHRRKHRCKCKRRCKCKHRCKCNHRSRHRHR